MSEGSNIRNRFTADMGNSLEVPTLKQVKPQEEVKSDDNNSVRGVERVS